MGELIEVGAFQLAVEVSGRSDAPWIILSNGLGTTMSMWAPQLPLLEAHRRVLRYDTRGLGLSDVPPGPYTMSGLVGDAIALLDHFSVERADVMGLSLGGRTAMGVALAHPDRVNRLIVADSRADTPPDQHEIWDGRAAFVRENGLAALWDDSRDRWFTEDSIRDNAETIAEFRRGMLETSPDGFIACIAALKETDFLKDLGTLSMPALFVGGEVDSGAPPDLMREMADAAPDARYVEIEAASHLSNIDNAAQFNAAVAEFLRFGATA